MGDKTKTDDSQFLTVKVAGGATAQCIGLMNAIYLRNKIGKPFKIKYFPYSTGTYWPFAIKFLLKDEELLDDKIDTRGLKDVENLQVGKIIRNHPLTSKKFSYEKILSIIRKMGLERFLQRIRGEHAIIASVKNLDKVNKRAKAVSGGFVPIFDKDVNLEMDERFKSRGLPSPFSLSREEKLRPDVVIHYRIGDKRTKFTIHQDFGGDGIVDPQSFKNIINEQAVGATERVVVVSDEPLVAQKLLAGVGIHAELNPIIGNLWSDLKLMSEARLLIGSWSQVSQLAMICVAGNGGRSYHPSTTQVGTKISWTLPNSNFYECTFLTQEHWIYSADFHLDSSSHKSYKTLDELT